MSAQSGSGCMVAPRQEKNLATAPILTTDWGKHRVIGRSLPADDSAMKSLNLLAGWRDQQHGNRAA